MATFNIRKDAYDDETRAAFVNEFDSAGDAVVTRIFNHKDSRMVAYNGELSEKQKEILNKFKV